MDSPEFLFGGEHHHSGIYGDNLLPDLNGPVPANDVKNRVVTFKMGWDVQTWDNLDDQDICEGCFQDQTFLQGSLFLKLLEKI